MFMLCFFFHINVYCFGPLVTWAEILKIFFMKISRIWETPRPSQSPREPPRSVKKVVQLKSGYWESEMMTSGSNEKIRVLSPSPLTSDNWEPTILVDRPQTNTVTSIKETLTWAYKVCYTWIVEIHQTGPRAASRHSCEASQWCSSPRPGPGWPRMGGRQPPQPLASQTESRSLRNSETLLSDSSGTGCPLKNNVKVYL